MGFLSSFEKKKSAKMFFFEKTKKVPRDIIEIQVLEKFYVIRFIGSTYRSTDYGLLRTTDRKLPSIQTFKPRASPERKTKERGLNFTSVTKAFGLKKKGRVQLQFCYQGLRPEYILS